MCPISISKPAKRITFVSDPLRGSKMANVTQCKRKGDREYASRCIVIDDDGRMVGLLVGWLMVGQWFVKGWLVYSWLAGLFVNGGLVD